ncbi:carboxymuconolactone decarboxylase family protein [Desulfosporosinus sp. BICA1-9]|uniref:carboxymuconolactone decarboxylase family protein n=1 Tax=Desulfosporosinus sp. BICA1-9 TaxID=1531958 RepID=UPI00054B03B3|nr:carboxymuconolactone decarboxylase family protein [Desulfosporosinus sp. BICA1-9]KJS50043.1 MAG: carboxymuconolactone decarboxylase [Peptococcaceae bacterium BRH_c23]KJS86358.1 MAG: carboxymuconolactone decarboxylase [Desulfosporosinus sp. BICA1-9]HBW35609.1 carboxymuconolactone decarboxylase family protein [Desulfosporosinus sp.]
MDDFFDNIDSTELNLKYFTEHHESIYKAYETYGRLIHEEGGPLDEKTCWLIKVALSTECQYPRALRTHIYKALSSGCTKEEIEHAILLVAPSAGFPRTMSGILALRSLLNEAETSSIH